MSYADGLVRENSNAKCFTVSYLTNWFLFVSLELKTTIHILIWRERIIESPLIILIIQLNLFQIVWCLESKFKIIELHFEITIMFRSHVWLLFLNYVTFVDEKNQFELVYTVKTKIGIWLLDLMKDGNNGKSYSSWTYVNRW